MSLHIVEEPNDQPTAVQEAIDSFSAAGWSSDAKWIGPLCVEVFQLRFQGASASVRDLLVGQAVSSIADSRRSTACRIPYQSLLSDFGDRDQVLLLAFLRLAGCSETVREQISELAPARGIPLHGPVDMVECRRIAAKFRAHGANFESALIQSGWPADYAGDLAQFARQATDEGGLSRLDDAPPIVQAMHVLVDAAVLDLTQVIDRGNLIAVGARRWGPNPEDVPQRRVPNEVNRGPDPVEDARSLSNWMMALGPRALCLFFPAMEQSKSEHEAAALALGVRDAIEKWLMQAVGHWTSFSEAHQALDEFGPASRLYFDFVDTRISRKPETASLAGRKAWFWFAWCTFEADSQAWEALSEDSQKLILRAATAELAQLRKLLVRASPVRKTTVHAMRCLLAEEIDGPLEEKQRASWEDFEWQLDNVEISLNILFSLGGVWYGLKPMLLAWRALKTPAVAGDLRYWHESGREPPPEYWHVLVAWPINLFHHYAAREESRDPDLVHLRGELAGFCLERLADRLKKAEREAAAQANLPRTNEQMIEPSEWWRYCFVRAVSALGINPEGKGHRVLSVASEIDPDPRVRDAANQCYQQMRRGVGLPEGVSSRRAIMSALWWIRQAHLLGLGIQPDPDGAQRTRVKELARTKESEQADKPVE